MRHIGECLDEIGVSSIVYSWGEKWVGRNYEKNDETAKWLYECMGSNHHAHKNSKH